MRPINDSPTITGLILPDTTVALGGSFEIDENLAAGTEIAKLDFADDTPAMRRYREQLGDVEVAFTSTKLHRNGKEDKPNPCAIDPADPGGVERLKSQLLRVLSTESRLALASQYIATGARNALLDLQTVLDTKLLAIRDIKDREVAEQKLRSFRHEFGQAGQRFEGAVSKQVELLGERLATRRKQHGTLVENIALLAERELAAFEMNDVARHWRTRRSGYWGYMHDLQGRIANRIFPKVQEMLGEHPPRLITTLHGTDVTLVGQDRSFFEITKFGIERSQGVTAVSEFLRRMTMDEFQIKKNIVAIPNFVDLSAYAPAGEHRDGAPLAKPGQKTADGYYNLEKMLKGCTVKSVAIGACGTCMETRMATWWQPCAG